MSLLLAFSCLTYFSISYPFISYQFRDGQKNKLNRLIAALVILAIGIFFKLSWDAAQLPSNLYSTLEISRQSNTLDIRRAYKKLSKMYHPDKFSNGNSNEKFRTVKFSYDILMDELQRDLYNRFGLLSANFDPRKDEMKLISDIIIKYVFWIVAAYIMTLPQGARAARTWITIIGIALLIIEACFCLSESTIPAWIPFPSLTEHEVLFFLHNSFPAAISFLRCISEYLYVDIGKTSISVIQDISNQQKSITDLLQQLQDLVEIKDFKKPSKNSVEEIKRKIIEVREQMDQTNENTSLKIEELKNSSSNPGANYYWIIFVLMYGGIYLFQ